jgi:hypothetical protein
LDAAGSQRTEGTRKGEHADRRHFLEVETAPYGHSQQGPARSDFSQSHQPFPVFASGGLITKGSRKAAAMTKVQTATYRITGDGSNWSVMVDGKREGDWETKEAAFEAAVAAASNAIKKGMAVEISIPGPSGEAALG